MRLLLNFLEFWSRTNQVLMISIQQNYELNNLIEEGNMRTEHTDETIFIPFRFIHKGPLKLHDMGNSRK